MDNDQAVACNMRDEFIFKMPGKFYNTATAAKCGG
jgi:hypothetical protein